MTSPRTSPPVLRSPRAATCIAIFLLGIFAGLCLHVAHRSSPTFDEPEQIGVGYASLTQGPHSITTFNFRLSQIWEALPWLAFDPAPRFPTVEERDAARQQNISFGRLLLFRAGCDPQQLIFASRVMVVLLAVLLGWLVFAWSRKLHGNLAGLFSLALYTCSPLVIAHASLATTELAVTLLFSLSVLACWRLLEDPSTARATLAGLAVGALLSTKISGVLIVPIIALMIAVRAWDKRAPVASGNAMPSRGAYIRKASIALLGAAFIAWLFIWAVYGGPAAAPAANAIPWEVQGRDSELSVRLIAQMRALRLLPDTYLFDLQNFTHFGGIRRAYLLGDYSLHGWWYFFPVAWLVKNPLPFHLALLAAGFAAWRLRRLPADQGGVAWRGLAPFAALTLVYGGAALVGNLNIGARHLLPLYPAVLVFAGFAVRLPLPASKLRAALLAALVGGSVAELALAHPHHLGYFNTLAGGSRNGHRLMVDSSSDWGESLPDIRRWLDERHARRASGVPAAPVFISYFGNCDLSYYGLGPDKVVHLPQYYDNRPIHPYALAPGTYIISATMLTCVYNGPVMGPWRPTYEKLYQERLRDMMELAPLLRSKPALDARIAREGADVWMQRLSDFDYLRFGRLCAYLRQREPDDWITPGVLVFELTQNDLAAALDGAPAELRSDGVIKGAELHADEELDFIK
jgi:4-amino-4-deoxy-L-arabinose transferase-like glycosyltransferase